MSEMIMQRSDRDADQSSCVVEECSDARLAELAIRYARLQRSLAALQVRAGRAQDEVVDALEAQTDHLLTQMYDAAWSAAATGAETLAGLEAKARILSDWCEDSASDVRDALAGSLCADVQRVSRASARKEIGA